MKLPTSRHQDWQGWVWPVPVTDGRYPVVTQEWKPGHDPKPGTPSGANVNHLGVDIMFRKKLGDVPNAVKHDASRIYIAPAGTRVLCAGPGKVWSTFHSTIYGWSILVDHGKVNDHVGGVCTFYQHLTGAFSQLWKKGDVVTAGQQLGIMGFAPGDPEGLRHLHFELRFPIAGVPQDDWRIDPVPYMVHWEYR